MLWILKVSDNSRFQQVLCHAVALTALSHQDTFCCTQKNQISAIPKILHQIDA